MSSSSLIDLLNLIQEYLTIILGILLVIGTIGNILNCLVFLHKKLRYNPCSVFFVAASIANTIVMFYYIIPTIYSTYNSPLENSNRIYCKLRLYIRNVLLSISRTYLTFACISCYAQTSRNVHIRDLCHRKYVLRIILFVPIIWFIIPLHIPFLTSIQNGKCSMWTSAGALSHAIYICFVAAILPTSLMIIFSILAYRNLRQMLRNVAPVRILISNEEGVCQKKEKIRLYKNDRQLCKMLFVQIIVYMFFTISYPIESIYYAVTLIIGESKSIERVAIENFILFLISSFLLSCYSAASFFIFLTSHAFRKSLREIFASILSLICQKEI
ncbi:unnamed protein product [Adineta steineri]|uniref:G-protein coupled receptors family 1 profile domain-containing protein n=1 Tax=Adineta steineri TaxID=433720 RepID=A0A813RRM7_9BILA|nr:unnamed protein product [Adineta steineri]CAF0924164.1 unnamed protein product [Adineta steineri]